MKKRLTITFFVTLMAVSAIARERIPFNDGWKFILDDDKVFSNISYDDSKWRSLSVPHDWSIEGAYDTANPSGLAGGYMPCGIGWYRKTFTVPDSLNGKRFFIRFGAIHMKSQVWINERMVGEYPNGYNTFEYDITPFIKPGQKNVLAVKVDNDLQPASRWYTGSGIYRDVDLIVTEQMHFINDGTFVTTPQVSEKEATIQIDYKVVNHAYPETVFHWTDNTSLYIWVNDRSEKQNHPENRVVKNCLLTSILYDSNGREVAREETKHPIGDFTENDFHHTLTVTNPHLWSASTPGLYKLESVLTCEGQVMDQQYIKTGIREIRYSPTEGMTINGKPEKLKGIALHQTASAFGSAVPRDVWHQRLQSLKEMGCNAVRPCPYTFPSYFYDLCDSLGIYTTDEVFDEWNRGQDWGYSESSYGKMAYTYHLYFEQWYKTDIQKMVRRDRNHPSVIMYMIGNEIPNQRIAGLELQKDIIKIFKSEDPTRPLTSAVDFFVGANIYGFMDALDIAGYNYIDRIHKDSLYLAEHIRYPNRVLLGSETYHHTSNHVSVRNNKSVIGEFVWVGFDYLGEIVWPGYRGWDSGIFDISGSPKPEYYLRKSYWSEESTVYIAVDTPGRSFDWAPRSVADHWNWEHCGDSLLNVCVYTNCEEVDLILNGKSLGKQKVAPDLYCVEWKTKFKAGTIKAHGYRNGKKVSEHTLKTAGEPVKLIIGDVFKGEKVSRVEVLAVDNKNVPVPFFDEKIKVTARDTKILGLDNGTQYDPQGEKYTSLTEGRMYNGKFVLFFETTQPGETAAILTTDGLTEVVIK